MTLVCARNAARRAWRQENTGATAVLELRDAAIDALGAEARALGTTKGAARAEKAVACMIGWGWRWRFVE
jgi:hypothetical protein